MQKMYKIMNIGLDNIQMSTTYFWQIFPKHRRLTQALDKSVSIDVVRNNYVIIIFIYFIDHVISWIIIIWAMCKRLHHIESVERSIHIDQNSDSPLHGLQQRQEKLFITWSFELDLAQKQRRYIYWIELTITETHLTPSDHLTFPWSKMSADEITRKKRIRALIKLLLLRFTHKLRTWQLRPRQTPQRQHN